MTKRVTLQGAVTGRSSGKNLTAERLHQRASLALTHAVQLYGRPDVTEDDLLLALQSGSAVMREAAAIHMKATDRVRAAAILLGIDPANTFLSTIVSAREVADRWLSLGQRGDDLAELAAASLRGVNVFHDEAAYTAKAIERPKGSKP